MEEQKRGKKTVLSCRLNEADHEHLKQIAKSENTNISELSRKIIERKLRDAIARFDQRNR